MSIHLLWLRRDLRLHDHAALHHALQHSGKVQPVFIFDEDILARFPSPDDRRLNFIAHALARINAMLQERGGGLLVLHGSAATLVPRLAQQLQASTVTAAEDYEPATRRRDGSISGSLQGMPHLVKDQLIFAPPEIMRDEGPYRVFTPYAKSWRAALTPVSTAPYDIRDQGRYADSGAIRKAAAESGLSVLDASSPRAMLEAIGYRASTDGLWPVEDGPSRLQDFINRRAAAYPTQRDLMGVDGTSRLSPYIRFGLVSVRECAGAALRAKADKWLAELIWREFYAMILYHYPESAHSEFNEKYRGRLDWSQNEAHFRAWQEGRTGYPLVDAAMRQLTTDGWMHNRARMVVASFLTKHLRIDWRRGEEHFAQYLMDYDLASNAGGWQWAASTGTDAQPWFRVFNPYLQSQKFDPRGDYIRRYVPELGKLDDKSIHQPEGLFRPADYPLPLVEHASARQAALEMFKGI